MKGDDSLETKGSQRHIGLFCIDVSAGKCTRNCPMGLNVNEMVKCGKMDSTECINCLACVDNYPHTAISIGIKGA